MGAGDGIVGTKSRDVLYEQMARVLASKRNTVYEHHEFNVPALANNVSLKTIIDHVAACTCQQGAFVTMDRAQRVLIRNVGSTPLVFRFNTNAAHRLTVDSGEYLDWDFVETTDLFITNASVQVQALRVALG